jgi:hypothetical protein
MLLSQESEANGQGFVAKDEGLVKITHFGIDSSQVVIACRHLGMLFPKLADMNFQSAIQKFYRLIVSASDETNNSLFLIAGSNFVIAAAKIFNFAGMKFPRQIGPDGVRPIEEIRQERSFPLRG